MQGQGHTFRILTIIAGLTVIGAAQAEPRFARMYKQQFGYAPSCNACHKDGGGTDLNPYGEAFKTEGAALAAFAAIANRDSDGDGASNASEASAKANPGSGQSTPANPGDWLSTANLIPREVQSLFPGVTAYKPLDGILTQAELNRAQAMGVTLVKEDETTIYVPVRGGKADGTALIVPARYGDKQFFVLVATDRQLKVTHAQPMHAQNVDGASDPALYRAAIGKTVDALPPGGAATLQAAVDSAIKKAGTLLWVRLKKAS